MHFLKDILFSDLATMGQWHIAVRVKSKRQPRKTYFRYCNKLIVNTSKFYDYFIIQGSTKLPLYYNRYNQNVLELMHLNKFLDSFSHIERDFVVNWTREGSYMCIVQIRRQCKTAYNGPICTYFTSQIIFLPDDMIQKISKSAPKVHWIDKKSLNHFS